MIAWNKRSGPGGGTRRLHQCRFWKRHWWGRNSIDVRNKEVIFTRYDTAVIDQIKVNANDNFVAANDNHGVPAIAAAA